MKKEEVYRLIEYDGIYDDKVKKNLKKLIKKYHPDKNKKDKKTIEIIYEVKKELENNKVSYKPNKKVEKVKDRFINEEECIKNIIRLEKIERGNNKELDKMYDDLSNTFKEYHDTYRKFCLIKNQFCELEDELKKIKKVNFIEKIVCLILIIFAIINIISANLIYLIISIFLLLIIVIWSYWFNQKIKIVKQTLKKTIIKVEKKSKEIGQIQGKIKELSDEIHELERKNTNVKNDIRFYKNMKD